ncbi:TIM44-like domain-containing protein [Microbacteriaceae bacterium K1510]|nr:TIM44-like domain-containing protein [Microbacteriaceae bacterium K1510]
MTRHRLVIAIAAIATALVVAAADYADARAGRGSSAGSRGTRTYSTPAPTQTAPSTAAPMQRSMTQPGQASTAGAATAARPGMFGGMFGGGLLGGLAAGFLGAGLFGLLFGHGLFGGMAGFASILGLILQVVLVVIVARLIFAWWQRRNAPAYASAAPSPGVAQGGPSAHAFNGLGSGVGGGLGGMFGGNKPAGEPLAIEKHDYDAFERLLGDVQAAYSAEDLNALRRLVTPEMLSYFSEDLSDNASRGLINQVSDVKLLQGDLAEAWREGNTEYATVAMRFALTDRMVERASGRTVEGGSPSEATELWTFMRSRGGDWLLSAIQQA